MHRSLANNHSWWELITRFAFSQSDSVSKVTSCICKNLRLLREHLIPSLFSLPYLSKLAFGSKLEIASPGRYLTITPSSAATALCLGLTANSSNIEIFVYNVEVTLQEF